MEFISYDEFKSRGNDEFFYENSSLGTLKVQVTTGYGTIAIPNTEITIYKNIEDEFVVFFRGVTDSSGIIDNIVLPAPNEENLLEPNYTMYDVNVVNDKYESNHYNIGMFGDVKVIQNIRLTPKVKLGDNYV